MLAEYLKVGWLLRFLFPESLLLNMLMGFILLFLVPQLLALGLEGRPILLHKQYKGVWPGDGLLAVAYMASVWVAYKYLIGKTGMWYQEDWYQWVKIGVAVAALLALTVPEVIAIIKTPNHPHVYTWSQFLDPTKIWHTVILALFAYMMMSVAVPAFFGGSWGFGSIDVLVCKVLIVIGFFGWMYFAVVWDNTRPRPDLQYIHVGNGWPWQRDKFWQGTP